MAVRVLILGAQAPAVLGKLRSSVLARRHAPATPEGTGKSTGAAHGAAPQGEHDHEEEHGPLRPSRGRKRVLAF